MAVPTDERHRLERAVDALAHTPRPRGAKKLASAGGALRLRVGRFRIIYEIEDAVLRVLVLKVAPRKDVYR